MALVSLGMPTYNAGAWLERAVNSIQRQTFDDWQLNICDNGSIDITDMVAARIAESDERITYYPSRVNAGATRLYNRCIDVANSPYFAWCAFDDLWEPMWLEECLEALHANPGHFLAYTKTVIVDGNNVERGIAWDKYSIDSDDPWDRYLTLINNLDLCNSVHGLMDTEVARSTRLFQPWERVGAFDCLFLAEMAIRGKWVQIDKPLFRRYRPAYGYTHATKMASLEKQDCAPPWLTLPTVAMMRAHVELVLREAPDDRKDELAHATTACFNSRYGTWMKAEMARARNFLGAGYSRIGWQEDDSDATPSSDPGGQFYADNVLEMLGWAERERQGYKWTHL